MSKLCEDTDDNEGEADAGEEGIEEDDDDDDDDEEEESGNKTRRI